MEGHGQAFLNQLRGVVGRKSIQLNNLELVSTILIFTSVQKMNDLVVQLKVQESIVSERLKCLFTSSNDKHFPSFKLFRFCLCLWNSFAG